MKDSWPELVKNGSKMGQKWVKNGLKMGQNWVKNGSEMGQKWFKYRTKGVKMGKIANCDLIGSKMIKFD